MIESEKSTAAIFEREENQNSVKNRGQRIHLCRIHLLYKFDVMLYVLHDIPQVVMTMFKNLLK
jgi:hypothetical protein